MDYEPLQIKDSQRNTQGGPPGWLAFTTILGAFALVAVVAFIAGMLM